MQRSAWLVGLVLTACGGTFEPPRDGETSAQTDSSPSDTQESDELDAGDAESDASRADPGSIPSPEDGRSPGSGQADASPVDRAEGDAGVPDPGASEPPRPFPPPPEGRTSAPPDTGPCGGCEEGRIRCLTHRAREVCAPDPTGCVRWLETESCSTTEVCWSGGECREERSCGYPNRVEMCRDRAQRICLDTDEGPFWSDARTCDPDSPPAHCDPEEDLLGFLRGSLHGVGSCVQVPSDFDGPCGPCGWHQCILDESTGEAHFECQVHEWLNVPDDMLPPGAELGYGCPAIGGPIQGRSKVKRGGTNPWTVASHYLQHGCPKPEGGL